jgi:serpin B
MKEVVFSVIMSVILLSLAACSPAVPDQPPVVTPPVEAPSTLPPVADNASQIPEEPEITTPVTSPPETAPAPKTISIESLHADKPWGSTANASNTDLATLVDGNNAFAFDLYQSLKETGENQFYSPYSISQALAMMYAGARGDTAQQMADTLHYTLPNASLHPAFGELGDELASRSKDMESGEGNNVQLSVANALWGQQGYQFMSHYLDLLAEDYGSELRTLDMVGQPVSASEEINDWVAEATGDKIKKVITPGDLGEDIRLVLASAIYLDADWKYTFKEASTKDQPFYLLYGEDTMVPMMQQNEDFLCAEGEGYQAVELPYDGGELSMVILLPREGWFEAFDEALDADLIKEIIWRLGNHEVVLSMPKFKFDAEFSLGSTLSDMGMPLAFSARGADFTGISEGSEIPLFIGGALHKAYVSVDELGTEAATVTVSSHITTSISPPPVVITIDRPFIFFIRDIQTGAILFVGRVTNPATMTGG